METKENKGENKYHSLIHLCIVSSFRVLRLYDYMCHILKVIIVILKKHWPNLSEANIKRGKEAVLSLKTTPRAVCVYTNSLIKQLLLQRKSSLQGHIKCHSGDLENVKT